MKGIQEVLFDLPLYGDEECSDSDCSRPAVIRHPESGKFYCAGDAWQLMHSHPVEMEDLSMVIKTRKFLLEAPVWICNFCDKQAERICDICRYPICFDHFTLIPRTGCACPECGTALEQEVAS